MDAYAWAHQNFFNANLPDLRLKRRLVETAAVICQNPCGTLPRALGATACLKGAYRLFAHEKVTHACVIQPHLERTRVACRTPGEYLMIEDTTCLSFSHRKEVAGLGRLTDTNTQGFLAHTCLAVRIEGWNAAVPALMPVGLFGQECWTREPPEGDRAQRKKQNRRDKAAGNYAPESERWGRALLGTAPPPQARWTLVADRESDIFGLMAQCEKHSLGYILRAAQPRRVMQGEQDVFEAVSQTPALGRFSLDLRARPGTPARQAQLEVRSLSTVVRPPHENPMQYAPLPLNLVEVCEVEAAQGTKEVHWLLLTNWPCETLAQTLKAVRSYACRWLIEEYHKALKTGTSMEDSQLSTADRLEALFAIHAVVAVGLLRLKLLARTHPGEAAVAQEISPEAMAVLEARFGRPAAGWTNDILVRTIARMGGYLNRKNDGPPGWLSIWRGWYKLMTMAEGYMMATQHKTYG